MNNEDVVPRDITSLYSLDYNGLLEITSNTHMLLQTYLTWRDQLFSVVCAMLGLRAPEETLL